MNCSNLPRPTFQKSEALARLASAQTSLTIVLVDVFGKEHVVYAQTGEDGRVRVVSLRCDEKLDLSPDALDEFSRLVRSIKVEVKS